MLPIALAMLHLSLGQCSQAEEGEPLLCPTKLPVVRSITVEKSARQAWEEKTQPVSCRSFVLTAPVMRAYLRRAKRTDAQSVHYLLAESPCYATGQVRFADGRTARWRVDQFSVGELAFSGREKIRLYCPACRMKPFVPQ